MPKDKKYLDKYERGLDFHPDPLVRSGKMSRETYDTVNTGMNMGLGAMGVMGAGTVGYIGNEIRKSEKELKRKRKEYKKSKGSMTQGSFQSGGRVMPKEKPKDFYAGEGYKGSPYMYPDYEEDKKDIKKGKKPQHMGMKKGSLAGKQKKLDINKDGKISGEDFEILRGKTNKMKGGGCAIKGTNFKGVY